MKKLVSLLTLLASSALMLVACQPKNDGNNSQEISYARQAYDRCTQTRGQDACNVVRSGTIMSVREYYGTANNTMGGYPYGGMAAGYPYGGAGLYYGSTQYTAQQIDAYFTNYLSKASNQEVADYTRNMLNSTTSGYNGFYSPTYSTTRGCSYFGCN